MDKKLLIAIDGPSGVGKTTVAIRVANKLGLKAVSTGALYRAVALHFLRKGVNIEDTEEIREALRGLSLHQEYIDGEIRTFMNGEDITDSLDSVKLSDMASKVASLPEVRSFLLDVQRDIAKGGAVVEGRDIGTVVLPDADVKVYLDASVEERARRRYEQLRKEGSDVSYEEALKDVKERDIRDSSRELAPLRRARDAFYIDSTHLSVDEVVDRIIKLVRSKEAIR